MQPVKLHHPLGASSAARWMACPGSVQMSESEADKTSVYAFEGTIAHEIAAECLVQGISAYDFVDTGFYYLGEVHDVTMVMADSAQAFVDNVRDPTFVLMALEMESEEMPEMLFEVIEKRVDLAPWTGGFSTLDHGAVWICGDKYVLVVTDFKHGSGVPVYAKQNPQIRIYAGGYLREVEEVVPIDKVVNVIHQPRIDDGTPSWEVMEPDALRDYMDEVRKAAVRTQSPDAPIVPGESQCRWCRAAGKCSAYAKYVQGVVSGQFTPVGPWTIMEMGEFQPEDYASLLENVDAVRAWASAVEKEAMKWALKLRPEGKRVGHFKLVEGRSNRSWKEDEDVVAGKLENCGLDDDTIWKKTLLSPAQAEKAVGKKRFKDDLADAVRKPPGKPTLVHENDKRPEISVDAIGGVVVDADAFDDDDY